MCCFLSCGTRLVQDITTSLKEGGSASIMVECGEAYAAHVGGARNLLERAQHPLAETLPPPFGLDLHLVERLEAQALSAAHNEILRYLERGRVYGTARWQGWVAGDTGMTAEVICGALGGGGGARARVEAGSRAAAPAQTESSTGEMRAWLVVLLCCGAAASAGAARLLAVLPTNTRSHYAMYGKIIDALARRNHNITVITHFPMKNPPPNVEEISLAGTMPEIVNNLTRQQTTLKPAFVRNLEQIMEECVLSCETVSKMQSVKALLNSSVTFDLVIVEVFGTECFLPLGERFQAPIVGLLSSVPLPWVNEQLGNPDATAYVPSYMVGYGQHMNLWERFVNTFAVIWAKILYKYRSQIPSQVIADQLFGPGPKLEELARNYSLVLSNSHFSINEVRPMVPSLVEVGGLHLDDSQILPRELKTFLDDSHEGVVYWSFGSMSRIETIPSETLSQIFQVLSELPQKVLVKMNKTLLPKHLKVPDNVFTKDWIPQYKTLCHPNVKLFISHGGLLGTQEAVACGVPMMMVPLYADQALNAHAMTDRGVARTLTLKQINTDSWRESLTDLLIHPIYRENALKLRDVFMDRLVSPLQTGVYWIEYVLRHKGAPHIRSPALDLPLYQYLLLDVVALAVTISLLIVFILHILFRYLSTRYLRWQPKEKIIFEKSLFRRSSFLMFLLKFKVKTN